MTDALTERSQLLLFDALLPIARSTRRRFPNSSLTTEDARISAWLKIFDGEPPRSSSMLYLTVRSVFLDNTRARRARTHREDVHTQKFDLESGRTPGDALLRISLAELMNELELFVTGVTHTAEPDPEKRSLMVKVFLLRMHDATFPEIAAELNFSPHPDGTPNKQKASRYFVVVLRHLASRGLEVTPDFLT